MRSSNLVEFGMTIEGEGPVIFQSDVVPRMGERVLIERWVGNFRKLVEFEVVNVSYAFREKRNWSGTVGQHEPAIISIDVKPVEG